MAKIPTKRFIKNATDTALLAAAQEHGFTGTDPDREAISDFFQELREAEAARPKRAYRAVPRSATAARREANADAVKSYLADCKPSTVSEVHKAIEADLVDARWVDTQINVRSFGVPVTTEGRIRYQGLLEETSAE